MAGSRPRPTHMTLGRAARFIEVLAAPLVLRFAVGTFNRRHSAALVLGSSLFAVSLVPLEYDLTLVI
jgi:hypothetical protein